MLESTQQRPTRGPATFVHCLLAVLMIASSVLIAYEAQAASVQPANQEPQQGTIPAAPAWLEPRGVNVADLVGVVPEEVLLNSMVAYSGGNALAFYKGGERSGNTVTITVRFESKNNVGATCLGMPGDFDSWPTVQPAGVLHIYAGKADVTREVVSEFDFVPAGQIQPVRNTGDSSGRYARTRLTAQFDANGGLILPANMGCKLYLPARSTELSGVFTLQAPRLLSATLLGSESLQFRSYIGPGYAGQLESLQAQMGSRYGNRHDDLNMKPPAGTEFVWVRYPATPVAAWDPAWSAGGTYRIRRQNAKLSVDHQNSMAIPLYGQFQDADQSPGTEFLPFFTDSVAVSSPEYFVPAGVAYDPCMTNGGCPASLLQTIYDARMEMTVYYLSLERVAGGLEQVPMRQVGPSWSPGDQPFAAAQGEAPATAGASAIDVAPGGSGEVEQNFKLYLPALAVTQPIEPDNPTANCPCGWFASDGRMVDFVQPQ